MQIEIKRLLNDSIQSKKRGSFDEDPNVDIIFTHLMLVGDTLAFKVWYKLQVKEYVQPACVEKMVEICFKRS